MRASRAISLLMLLQTRGRMSADALAAEIGVSVRTVYRTVDQLSAAGVPVYAERGRRGGFRLLDGWRTELTGLTPSEAQALFLSGLPGPAAELGLGDAMGAARLKLLAALPDGWQRDAERISSRFHLDPLAWFRSAARPEHLPAVADAVWTERRLTIGYRSGGRVSERTIEPLGLALKAGVWYVVARTGDDEPRTYRLSNVVSAVLTDQRFARPAGFDLARHWAQATRTYEAGLQCESATLRASPNACALLLERHPAAASTASAPDGDGWVTLTIPIESIDRAAEELPALGAGVEAIAPAALRERMAATANRLAALYA